MRPTEDRKRVAICGPDISRLKIATGRRSSTPTCSAMLSANAVLPMDGRPATTIMSPGCRPEVMRSRSTKPVGTPVMSDWLSRPVGFHALDHFAEQGLDRTKPLLLRLPASAISKTGLGLVEQRLDVAPGRIERIAGDFVADGDQLAQHGTLAHDLGVAPDVGGRGRVVGDLAEIGEATGLIDLVRLFDGLKHRHHVGRTAHLDQLADVAEDAAMVVAVEIGLAHHVADAVPGGIVEQQAADQRLLGLDGMRGSLSAATCESTGCGGLKART